MVFVGISGATCADSARQGINTPPMGIVLYSMVEVAEGSFEEICASVLQNLIPLMTGLFLIVYVSEITMFVPNLLRGVQ